MKYAVTRCNQDFESPARAVASQDELTQRRVGQIGEVIGAVEDVATDEEDKDDSIAEKRVEEAHDIIHRVAAILAMEEGNDGGGGDEVSAEKVGNEAEPGADEPLAEVAWDGTLEGETIELKEDEEE